MQNPTQIFDFMEVYPQFISATNILTARVRSTTGGYVFTGVCLFNFRGGVPHVRSGGEPPSQVWGVPHLRFGWGYPISGSGGGYPVQFLMVGGTPRARSGWQGEYPGYSPNKTWVLPDLGWGTPPPSRPSWGNLPHPGMGYPPPQTLDGAPPPLWDWVPPTHPPTRQSSIASTCYAAGSVPLAFTQEDFLA